VRNSTRICKFLTLVSCALSCDASAPVCFAAPAASDSSEALADLASWASSTKAREEALRKDAAQAKAAGERTHGVGV
jgi:hypothetical protein